MMMTTAGCLVTGLVYGSNLLNNVNKFRNLHNGDVRVCVTLYLHVATFSFGTNYVNDYLNIHRKPIRIQVRK